MSEVAVEAKPLVKYKIIESKGFSNHELPAHEALTAIKTYVQTNGGWFYLDGAPHLNMETVTPQMLEDASMVTVTNVILGGADADEVRQIISSITPRV